MTDKPLQTRRVSIKRSDPNKAALKVVKGEVLANPQIAAALPVEPVQREREIPLEISPEKPEAPRLAKVIELPVERTADDLLTKRSSPRFRSMAALFTGDGVRGGKLLKTQQGRLLLGSLFLFVIAGAQLFGPTQAKQAAPELASINRGINVDDILGEKGLRLGLSRRNPSISWFEKNFCTGSKMAGGCSKAVYHPYLTWWENYAETDYIDEKDRGRALKTIANTFKKRKDINKFRESEVLRSRQVAAGR